MFVLFLYLLIAHDTIISCQFLLQQELQVCHPCAKVRKCGLGGKTPSILNFSVR